MSTTILQKILEIGNVNVAFYIAFIIFLITNNFRFVLSFIFTAAITKFLKLTMQPFNPSGHMAMATIIILWTASFLENKLLIFLIPLVILIVFAYSLIETNSHTISETIFGFAISLICFIIFV